MNFDDAMQRAGAGSIAGQVAALGGTGRGGGTRKLAEAWAAASGKSVRSQMRAVQRALKTGTPPAKQTANVAAAGARSAAAGKMRNAQAVSVGTVGVKSTSDEKAAGNRNLGVLMLDPQARAELAEAAGLYESGMIAEAEAKANAALLGAYAASKGDNREQARGAIKIDDYRGGLSFV